MADPLHPIAEEVAMAGGATSDFEGVLQPTRSTAAIATAAWSVIVFIIIFLQPLNLEHKVQKGTQRNHRRFLYSILSRPECRRDRPTSHRHCYKTHDTDHLARQSSNREETQSNCRVRSTK
eukprot:GHVR01074739.1.p1 GENE.GHVR01074739.1~~GHVR01074739.1.p1  ORF type:complete len:121 (+),score=1.18 GHVR01074739.1:116-478(+)